MAYFDWFHPVGNESDLWALPEGWTAPDYATEDWHADLGSMDDWGEDAYERLFVIIDESFWHQVNIEGLRSRCVWWAQQTEELLGELDRLHSVLANLDDAADAGPRNAVREQLQQKIEWVQAMR
jgi:hypothetical protein